MGDALAMSLVQRIRHLDGIPEHLVERQRPLGQPLGQRLAFEMLHDQEVDAGFVTRGAPTPHSAPWRMPNVIKRADVRVVQTGDGLGFPLEPLAQIGIVGDMRQEHLDGDGAVQAGVAAL